jgi:hypothetical protein
MDIVRPLDRSPVAGPLAVGGHQEIDIVAAIMTADIDLPYMEQPDKPVDPICFARPVIDQVRYTGKNIDARNALAL